MRSPVQSRVSLPRVAIPKGLPPIFLHNNTDTHNAMKKFLLIALATCLGLSAQAQNTTEPKGKAIVHVFGDFHSALEADSNNRGFFLERSYLGYEYKLEEGLTLTAIMDVGSSKDVTDMQRIAFVKNAMVSWKKDKFTINGGIIPTKQIEFQELLWGYRYIMQSYQGQYGYSSSADLGVSATYALDDLSIDATILNGEGYKKLQQGDGLYYGVGLTLSPIKGLFVRVYGCLNESGNKEQSNSANYTLFVGYKTDIVTFGAEHSRMYNTAYTEGADLFGYSLYTNITLSPKTNFYARFDNIDTNHSLNALKAQQVVTVGAQFKLGKYVKLAPNVKFNMPKAEGAKEHCTAYLNFFFGF